MALLIGIPTLITALGVSAIEASRFWKPNAPLFVTPPEFSFADAIAGGNVLRVYELIRAGADPNRPIAVRHPVLTGGRPLLVTPLVWAVATDGNQTVALLLSFGARLDATMQRRAVCLAEQLGNDEVARLLELEGGASAPEPCPKREASGAALASWLTEPQ